MTALPTPDDRPAWTLADLPATGRAINEQITAAGLGTASGQVLCLAEEVGEFVGAYRRWVGQARRSGTRGEMEAELADVVLAAFVLADRLDIDLEAAVAAKNAINHQRGWREERAS